jgi:hypothetical protein
MYRQGQGWITSVWDAGVKCYRTSGEMNYWEARRVVGATNCRNPKTCTKHDHREE